MESDAENSQHGMDSDTESLPTWSPEEEAELTRREIQSGAAINVIGSNSIPAPSSPLSDEEQ